MPSSPAISWPSLTRLAVSIRSLQCHTPAVPHTRNATHHFFAHRPAEGVVLIAETGLLEFGGNERAISLGDILAHLVCSAQPGAGVLHSDRLRLVRFGNCSRM